MTAVLKTITGHAGAIYDACVSGNFLFTTSADRYTVRWKIKEGVQDKLAIKSDNSAFRICLLKNSETLVIGSSKGNLHCIDLNSKQEIKNLAQHKSSIFSLTENTHRNVFYSTDAEGYFCVWDSDTFELKLTLPFACGKIRNCAINEDGSLVSLSCKDGKIRILETGFYNEIITLKAHKDGANISLFDGACLISGGKDAFLKQWNWKQEKLIKEIPAHNFAIYDIIKLDGQYITASFDKTIKIWDKDLNVIKRLDRKDGGHVHTVNRLVAFNQKEFFSLGDDKKIIHWQIA